MDAQLQRIFAPGHLINIANPASGISLRLVHPSEARTSFLLFSADSALRGFNPLNGVLRLFLCASASPRQVAARSTVCARGEAPLLTFYRTRSTLLLMANRAEVPYGTLDLMVLKTLDTLGPQHGYGIARRIEQVAESSLELNQGTIYPALLRLEQRGWISSEWGSSENNRKARFYSITRSGRKQLAAETKSWSRTVAMMARLLESEP